MTLGTIQATTGQMGSIASPWTRDDAPSCPSAPASVDAFAPTARDAEAADLSLPLWRTAALAGCGVLGLFGGAAPQVALPMVAARFQAVPTAGASDATRLHASALATDTSGIAPVTSGIAPVLGADPSPVARVLGADTTRLDSGAMAGARLGLDTLKVPALNPFAFTVASAAFAMGEKKAPKESIRVEVPDAYGKPIKADLNLSSGPQAPMLVIIPGAFGSRKAASVNQIEQLALHNGMNFVAFDNPLNPSLQGREPAMLPGNPREEARALYQALRGLRERYPDAFSHVSVTGYSYGGLLSAGLVDAQAEWMAAHPDDKSIINGSVAAMSPPQSLRASMRALDSLHQVVDTARAGSVVGPALKYLKRVKHVDFNRVDPTTFPVTPTGAEERKLVDRSGFRSGFEHMLTEIDLRSPAPQLPLHQESFDDRDAAEALHAQNAALRATTYDDYMRQYVRNDPWYARHQTTPEQVLEHSRYSDLLAAARAQGIPVMTVVSADDFILQPADVATFRDLEAHPAANEVTRVFPHGGHTGLYWSPEVREAMGAFLAHPPTKAPAR